MIERHPNEHFMWAASAAFFVLLAFFVYEAVHNIPVWFFQVTGFVFCVTMCVVFPMFFFIKPSALHKISHTEVPKQAQTKPRASRSKAVLEKNA